eukprot:6214322-Pleurochrysis_carterae.AAC.1
MHPVAGLQTLFCFIELHLKQRAWLQTVAIFAGIAPERQPRDSLCFNCHRRRSVYLPAGCCSSGSRMCSLASVGCFGLMKQSSPS